eukprot:CAMPEP_0180002322 /NCGR_PEP_ID=MMETSP0984-20121128/10888_1 /TAXON_ID=483367 /ORGANISM="non described non described, Strain CCMP 2436" /LENGTH=56 /DNA_ID=CAMNT_0021922535 /DNA_START=92 /DNA_END=259 /DNA_ORIENTATION=+
MARGSGRDWVQRAAASATVTESAAKAATRGDALCRVERIGVLRRPPRPPSDASAAA